MDILVIERIPRRPTKPSYRLTLSGKYTGTNCSDRVALEAPIVALGLLEHLPEGALPLTGLLVLLLDPERDLHHAPGNIPIAPQGLDCLVIIARPRSLVEKRAPRILVLANELDLLERVFRLPLLNLLTDLADGRLCRH